MSATGKITATTAGIDVPTSAAGNVYSGTYTPTTTVGTNVSAATAYLANYARVGNWVHVSGVIDLDPVSIGATDFQISLPVASNFSTSLELSGVLVANGVTESMGIVADTANDTARVTGITVNTANHQTEYQFSYRVV